MATTQQRLHSIREAAAQLGISRSTLYVLMGEGKVRSVVIGKRRLIPDAAIAEFVDSLSATSVGA